jgi:hypothetical protein
MKNRDFLIKMFYLVKQEAILPIDAIEQIEKREAKSRQDLLKELRGEVEGMKLPTSTRNYITKAEPINKKLQDVIKLLEKYE